MSRLRIVVVLIVAFGAGAVADREYRLLRGPKGTYARMLHVGILVPDLDKAVAKWRAEGFNDIVVSAPEKGEGDYHGQPIDIVMKKAFITGTVPQIELMQPVGDAPNPWSGELKERGEVLHHIAYDVPNAEKEMQTFQRLGMVRIAGGRWPDGPTHWGTWDYVRDPASGLIVEFISRVSR
jgi:catechol 2,3-dioxygenase-like lactoylglutathione lyase family enzyme